MLKKIVSISDFSELKSRETLDLWLSLTYASFLHSLGLHLFRYKAGMIMSTVQGC